MSEYLSKEEIKQWRSSLEKITLEEFAARLGKKVEEKKETNDLIDIVLHGKPVISEETSWSSSKVERLSAIADRAYEKEKELYVSPFSAQNLKLDNETPAKETKKTEVSKEKEVTKKAPKAKTTSKKAEKTVAAAKEIISEVKTGDSLRDEVRVVFKKALTDREQKVFDYFVEITGYN
jgi:cell pole-organizing protein PopZ